MRPGPQLNHYPQMENYDFFGTKHPMKLKPVAKFEIFNCFLVEKRELSIYPACLPIFDEFQQNS